MVLTTSPPMQCTRYWDPYFGPLVSLTAVSYSRQRIRSTALSERPLLLVGPNEQHRHRRIPQHPLRVAAQEHSVDTAPSMRTHDDQVGPLFPRFVQDHVRHGPAAALDQRLVDIHALLESCCTSTISSASLLSNAIGNPRNYVELIVCAAKQPQLMQINKITTARCILLGIP